MKGARNNLWLCGQTAYMVARHLVSPDFAVSADELKNIHNRLLAFKEYKNNYQSDIEILSWLAVGNEYHKGDFGVNYAKTYKSNDRGGFKDFIRQSLLDGKPVLFPVEYNFVKGNIGHFIIAIGLDVTDGGAGSVVYYKDVLEKTGKTKSEDYTIVLDSNKRNSINNPGMYIGLRLSGK